MEYKNPNVLQFVIDHGFKIEKFKFKNKLKTPDLLRVIVKNNLEVEEDFLYKAVISLRKDIVSCAVELGLTCLHKEIKMSDLNLRLNDLFVNHLFGPSVNEFFDEFNNFVKFIQNDPVKSSINFITDCKIGIIKKYNSIEKICD